MCVVRRRLTSQLRSMETKPRSTSYLINASKVTLLLEATGLAPPNLSTSRATNGIGLGLVVSTLSLPPSVVKGGSRVVVVLTVGVDGALISGGAIGTGEEVEEEEEGSRVIEALQTGH